MLDSVRHGCLTDETMDTLQSCVFNCTTFVDYILNISRKVNQVLQNIKLF